MEVTRKAPRCTLLEKGSACRRRRGRERKKKWREGGKEEGKEGGRERDHLVKDFPVLRFSSPPLLGHGKGYKLNRKSKSRRFRRKINEIPPIP